MLIFFGVSVQAITKEIVEEVRKSVVLLSVSQLEDPPVNARNSLCSGVVINERGHVLTNFHCIYKQKTILLYYWNEEDWTEYKVKVIGEDPLADLALLEVIGLERKVPYLKFAKDGDTYPGTEIFALGHPMGMAWSLSKGIVSSINRYARHPYIKSIQVDAAINKGNSGGPIFNNKGEIVGIASLIVSRIDQNAGVGIAVRSDIAKHSLTSMLETGKVDRPALGVMIIPLFGKDNHREKILKDNPNRYVMFPIADDDIWKNRRDQKNLQGLNQVFNGHEDNPDYYINYLFDESGFWNWGTVDGNLVYLGINKDDKDRWIKPELLEKKDD